ncbi:MAG TPA: methyl-accepting chemotaxis protein [Thermoanaerobaculia bacterium]|jgi:methyl-accepting chemotaxis protein|nr:methyl-accepting chemotaxis protein [Thermoanaerobaculia bacterium]
MPKDAAESINQSRLGLLIVSGVALSGLVLLMVAEAGSSRGAQSWLFNVFFLAAAAGVGLYVRYIHRGQQELWQRVDGSERRNGDVEKTLIQALERLRAGDLVNVAERSRELPGKLSTTFSNATNALDVLAQQIQASSVEVASAANSVNEIASELASGSSQQAASVVEITAAMEELARTASQIADNAATQAELAQKAEESGNLGKMAVEEAVVGVEEVRKRIHGIATRADTLGNRSKEIYRVLDLITDIAQETHILSLNAAIEAAAAGEHSRRFSVVAEEVRRLAQRSQESVESVRNLLDEFASSIRATVVATEEGSNEASRVLERARAAAGAIEDLRDASADTARVAREISLATQQQNAASDEVVLTLKEVSHVVQRMADGLKQFSETADRLNQLGLIIQMLAQSFHLDSPHSLKHLAELWAGEVRRRLGNWEAIDRLLSDLVQRQPYVECLYFYDGKGGQVALTVNRSIIGDRDIPAAVRAGEGFTERPWYKAAVAEKHTILTPLFDSLLTEQPIFTAASPIYEKGDLIGVLGLDVNVDHWTKI